MTISRTAQYNTHDPLSLRKEFLLSIGYIILGDFVEMYIFKIRRALFC